MLLPQSSQGAQNLCTIPTRDPAQGCGPRTGPQGRAVTTPLAASYQRSLSEAPGEQPPAPKTTSALAAGPHSGGAVVSLSSVLFLDNSILPMYSVGYHSSVAWKQNHRRGSTRKLLARSGNRILNAQRVHVLARTNSCVCGMQQQLHVTCTRFRYRFQVTVGADFQIGAVTRNS